MKTPDKHPVTVTIPYPQEQSRILALASVPFLAGRLFLLLPALVLVYFITYLGFILGWVNALAVVVTGKSPKNLHRFMVGMLRFTTRTTSYMYGLTDKYPPFKLDD